MLFCYSRHSKRYPKTRVEETVVNGRAFRASIASFNGNNEVKSDKIAENVHL